MYVDPSQTALLIQKSRPKVAFGSIAFVVAEFLENVLLSREFEDASSIQRIART